MGERKKSSKFLTSIVIGGALGSMAAWVFGSKRRNREGGIKEKIDQVLHPQPEPKKGFFRRLFGG